MDNFREACPGAHWMCSIFSGKSQIEATVSFFAQSGINRTFKDNLAHIILIFHGSFCLSGVNINLWRRVSRQLCQDHMII